MRSKSMQLSIGLDRTSLKLINWKSALYYYFLLKNLPDELKVSSTPLFNSTS